MRLVEATNINGFLSRAPRAPLGSPRDLPFRQLNASVEQLYGLGLQYRQELQSAVHAISAAHEGERLARLSRVPDFSVGERMDRSDSELLDSIKDGKGRTMPAWLGILSNEECEAVLQYIREDLS